MKSILVVGARGIPDVEGGIEKNAENLFPILADRGWKICIAGRKPFVRTSHYRGVSLWQAPTTGWRGFDGILYAVSTLLKAIRMRPDIVHLCGFAPAFLLWAYKLIGCKTVVRLGTDWDHRTWNRVEKWVMQCARYQLRWADRIIAVTPALAKKLRSSGIGQTIHVIGNALDRPDRDPDGPRTAISGDYILFVGQISRQKNILSLINAFRVFVESHPHMQLVIVGNWDKRAGRRQIEALGDDRIVMLGSLPRSSLVPLYRGARFFVNPSIREGHSNTLLEAISLGCPVLLSDLPENRDLRLNAKHYFRPEDRQSLVSALDRAHANPDVFRVNYNLFPQWEEIAEQMIQIYEKLSARTDRRRVPAG